MNTQLPQQLKDIVAQYKGAPFTYFQQKDLSFITSALIGFEQFYNEVQGTEKDDCHFMIGILRKKLAFDNERYTHESKDREQRLAYSTFIYGIYYSWKNFLIFDLLISLFFTTLASFLINPEKLNQVFNSHLGWIIWILVVFILIFLFFGCLLFLITYCLCSCCCSCCMKFDCEKRRVEQIIRQLHQHSQILMNPPQKKAMTDY